MNIVYSILVTTICFLCLQEVGNAEKLSVGSEKRNSIESYDGPLVLNNLLKQPILSFGSWFAPFRGKRFSPNIDYVMVDPFYPQPIIQSISPNQLRRALRKHKSLRLKI